MAEIKLSFREYNRRLSDTSKYLHSDGAGNYSCTLCGDTWRAYKRYLYWPIRLHWKRNAIGRGRWFTWHGWQVGFEGIERRIFGWTLHIGALKVSFGSKDRVPERTTYTYVSSSAATPAPDAILDAEIVLDLER